MVEKDSKKNYYDLTLALALFVCFLVLANHVYDYGLHFDEVNRLNPLFALFNPAAYPNEQAIWSISLGGIKIPMIYKEYISSLSTFYMLPIVLFRNPIIGLKTMYIVYFGAEILSVYLYLKRFNKNFAIGVSLILLTNPLIYPDIFYGFANCFHVIFIVLSLYQFEKYYQTNSLKYLFGGVFFICFGTNLSFYTIWNVVALLLSSMLIDFPLWKATLKSIKAIIVILSGAFLGLFNFILYNLFCGFPTVTKLFEYIFSTNEFEMDGVSNESLYESITITLEKVDYMLNGKLGIYIALIALMIGFWALLAVLKIKGKAKIDRHMFYPILIVLFTIACLLISPKPRFAYHWLRLSPTFEILIILSFVFLNRYLFKRLYSLPYIATSLFLIFAFWQCNEKIRDSKVAVEKFHLSNDYEFLANFFEKNNVRNEQIFYLEWGIEAPVYFSTKGMVAGNGKPYHKLMNMDESEILPELMQMLSIISVSDIYIPLYKNQIHPLNQNIYPTVVRFLEECSLKYSIVEEVWLEDILLIKVHADSNYFQNVTTLSSYNEYYTKSSTELPQSCFQGYIEGTVCQSDFMLSDIWGWCFIENEQIEFMMPLDANGTVSGLITCNLPREDVYKAYGTSYSENAGFRGVYKENAPIESILIGTKEGNLYQWNLQTNP